MKVLFLILSVLTLTSSQVFNGDEWKQVKSPLDSPHYKLIMSEMFPENSFSVKTNRGGRIAGGQPAALGQFKYQVLLMTVDTFGDTYVCGGSILSHNWILTAAHCLEDIKQVSVYVGIIDRVNGPAVWGIDITDKNHMILHENYNPNGLVNDIALVRLVNTIVSNPNVDFVQLPLRSDAGLILDGKIATVAGFGRYTDISGPSPNLRYVSNPIAPNEKCEKVYGKANVRESSLCFDTIGGRSSCQGDSGGGLVTELRGKNVLVGVVSFGAAVSCTQGHPAVFTRVTSFLDWIGGKTNIRID